MAKRRKLSTEKSLQLQEEIEAYLRWKSSPESRESGELPFEQRLDKALRGEDPELFEDIAALFWGRRINLHPSSEGYEKGVEQVAVLARKWLESLQQPDVTAENVKEIAETIWAARAVGYKPNENLVFTQNQQGSIELWTRKDDTSFALEKKRVTLSMVVHRPPGELSELDCVSALHYELVIPESAKLRADIAVARRSFPETAWNRVWKSPGLSDLKRKRGAPKKQH
jgi:hypothetical protein